MRFFSHIVFACLLFAGLHSEAQAFRGGGGFRGGGARVSASTTYQPGAGVTRSATVAGGRYYRPTTLPAYNPINRYPGAAIRTTRTIAAGVAYRTAAGYSYYYGTPVYTVPSSACYAVMWEGETAYNCNGSMYVYQDGQYYPIMGY